MTAAVGPRSGRGAAGLAVAVLLLAGMRSAPAGAADDAPWISLGDSYSAGEGTVERGFKPHDFSPDFKSGAAGTYPSECHRTSNAYAPLLAREGVAKPASNRTELWKSGALRPQPYTLTHLACTGAVISDVTGRPPQSVSQDSFSPQTIGEWSRDGLVDFDRNWKSIQDAFRVGPPIRTGGLHGPPGQGGRYCNRDRCRDFVYQKPQIEDVPSNAKLITLTIGGNDIDFGNVARCLVLRVLGPDCVDRFRESGHDPVAAAEALSPSLASLYRQLALKAPNARILVLTYPRLLPSTYPGECRLSEAFLNRTELSHRDWEWGADIFTALNNAIATAVAGVNDPRVELVPMDDAFKGMELCAAGTGPKAVNPLMSAPQSNTFHPSSIGYVALAKQLQWHLENTSSDPFTPDGMATEGAIDTVLIIDSSGSMLTTDPTNLRSVAGTTYLRSALHGDYVGVVEFDATATTLSAAARLPQAAERLDRLLRGIDSSGGTSIASGLQAGCAVLRASTSGNAKKAALLLTDGDDASFSGQDECFRSRGWPVYTVGFADAGDVLLRRISTNTGGEYQRVPTPSRLSGEFQRIRARIAGTSPPPSIASVIGPGQVKEQNLAVAPRQALATFSTSWPGSDVEMSLVSPSGRRVDRASRAPDVAHDRGARFEVYSIREPEAGDWKVSLRGVDVARGGEEVVLTPTSLARNGAPPTAVFSTSTTTGRGPLDVRFDSTGSADPDGPIATRFWDFGDGATAIADAVMTHTYSRPGRYRPQLVVVGSDGELAAVSDTVIEVSAPANRPGVAGTGSGRDWPLPLVAGAAGGGLAALAGAALLVVGLTRPSGGRRAPAATLGPPSRCACGSVLLDGMRFCDSCGRPVAVALAVARRRRSRGEPR